jgi:hypothetical protein
MLDSCQPAVRAYQNQGKTQKRKMLDQEKEIQRIRLMEK